MSELMKKVREHAKIQGIDNVNIAAHIGTTPTSITYYFDGTNHMNFSKFIRMIHYIYKSEYDDLIIEYCEYCNHFPRAKKAQAVREALDWSMGRWNSELTQHLLDLEKEYSPKTYEIYNLLFLSREGKISLKEFFRKVHYLPYNLKTSDQKNPEVQVLIDLCNMYYCHFREDFEGIYYLSEFTFEKIDKIKSEFLRYSYTICVNEMLSVYYLRSNKIKECKSSADKLIQDDVKALFPFTYLYGLYLMSEIYVFTNYQTSLYYINMAISEIEKMQFTHYKRKYDGMKKQKDFIKIVNEDYEDLCLEDKAERLHYLAMLGDDQSKEEANKVLESIIEERKELTPFETCYKAILNKDLKLMIRAEEMFMVGKDFYYIKLARKFIKEWGGIKESNKIN
ncbi:AimR family lysis-lysogeny pheromone receptor [Priestia aryabhattai]|uniref:AimR family lysis-lysogeny pheromone receptor n=1 Tax=Priestia aryabhattai TaxID=412384 RepID=A0ABD7X4N3_PRIAR|nr:AimR family lysis-lysogeny pheromone receptor [Priestia aryabhattai]WEA47308.1 AimR family lysis-lysogeny pheromone receptor [Priestia aryabhattai]